MPTYMDYGQFFPLEKSPALMSMKYAELYSMPQTTKYPELVVPPGQYDEALFPVDTPNIIPTPNPAATFKQYPQPEVSVTNSGNNSESDYLFSDDDNLDLNSLLSLSAPANDDSKDSYLIESDPLNLLGSLDDLDLISPTALDFTLPDGIHYWNGFQKDCDPDNSKQAQTVADPFVTDLYGALTVDKGNTIPMDTTPTSNPENILLTMRLQDHEMSPASEISSPMSGDSLVPSSSPGTPDKWQHNLRDLFEQTFDLSDIEGEFMPPPNKRQEDSPSNTQYWPLDKNNKFFSPAPSSPVDNCSPSPHSFVDSTPPTPHEDNTKTKNKTKVLLFGKDEGEIIHKLLAAESTVRARPLTRDKLITMPVEEFNQLLTEAQLTEIEVAFMKEWRRRGKNKAAAQIARKRKREEVSGLDEDVQVLRQQKVELEKKYDRLRSLVESLKERSSVAEDRLFQKQSKVLMEPVSRNTHLIHITDDDKLLLIPRVSSKILVVNH